MLFTSPRPPKFGLQLLNKSHNITEPLNERGCMLQIYHFLRLCQKRRVIIRIVYLFLRLTNNPSFKNRTDSV